MTRVTNRDVEVACLMDCGLTRLEASKAVDYFDWMDLKLKTDTLRGR